jgi:predicted amidohydrolase YtcJ
MRPCAVFLVSAIACAQQTVYYNAKVITMAGPGRFADAFLVDGNQFAAVGNTRRSRRRSA